MDAEETISGNKKWYKGFSGNKKEVSKLLTPLKAHGETKLSIIIVQTCSFTI
jgi:hypothetical protein